MKNVLLLAFLVSATFGSVSTLEAQQQLLMQKVDTTYKSVNFVKITGSFAKISIANNDISDIKLSGELRANEKVNGFVLSHTLVADTLAVLISYPKDNWVTHSGELRLSLPKGISVDIENTSGYIDIISCNDLKVNAVTTSGKFVVRNCGGTFALRSISGDITASKYEGSLTIVSNTGKISTSECVGNLDITNLSGESSIITHNGNIIAESTSGKIQMESITGDIKAKTASATMKVSKVVGNLNLTSFSGTMTFFDIKGVINNDSGAGDQLGQQINLTGNSKFVSTEGSIKLRLLNQTPDLTFKMVSESGFIQVRGESKKKKLKLGKGALLVESYSTTGGQVVN